MIKQFYIKDFDWFRQDRERFHTTVLGLFYYISPADSPNAFELDVISSKEVIKTYKVESIEQGKQYAVVDLISRLKTEVFTEKNDSGKQQTLF